MFILLLIYILIGIIWNIKTINDTKKVFKKAIEERGEEPSIAESLFALMLLILLWAPIEIYAIIKSEQIIKENKKDKENKED